MMIFKYFTLFLLVGISFAIPTEEPYQEDSALLEEAAQPEETTLPGEAAQPDESALEEEKQLEETDPPQEGEEEEEEEEEEEAVADTCEYTDETLGTISIKFRETETGAEAIEISPEGTDGIHERLQTCLNDDLAGRRIIKGKKNARPYRRRKNPNRKAGGRPQRRKRPGNKKRGSGREDRPSVLLQKLREQLKGKANQITNEKLQTIIALAQKFLEVRAKIAERKKKKQTGTE